MKVLLKILEMAASVTHEFELGPFKIGRLVNPTSDTKPRGHYTVRI